VVVVRANHIYGYTTISHLQNELAPHNSCSASSGIIPAKRYSVTGLVPAFRTLENATLNVSFEPAHARVKQQMRVIITSSVVAGP
jgi:hypothetical protein